MAELFASGLVLDVIVGLVLLEAALLIGYRRLTGRGPAPREVLPNLVAGLFLMLAVRAALVDATWTWVAFWLLAGLFAHLFDLALRWRG